MRKLFSIIKSILLHDLIGSHDVQKDEDDGEYAEYKYPNDCKKCKYYRPMTNSIFECDVHFPCFKQKG